MASHHRTPDRSRQEPRSGTDVAVHEAQFVASADGTTDGDGAEIAAAIEREELRARVHALERELAASERHRRDLIEQYERLLTERDAIDEPTDGAGTDRSRLGELLVPGR